MPETTYPGPYVEERKSQLIPFQGVTTANFATLGKFDRGPTDIATFTTGIDQAQETFGPFTLGTLAMTSLQAYFAQGGRRAWLTRVVADDAAPAVGYIETFWNGQQIELGDGTTKTFTRTAGTTTVHHAVVPGTMRVTYRPALAPVMGAAPTLEPNAPDGATTRFDFKMPGTLVPGTITVHTLEATIATTYVDRGKDGVLQGPGASTTPRGFVDYATGYVTFAPAVAPDAASSVTVDSTPAGTLVTLVDDGSGHLTGASLSVPGTIGYADGSYTFTVALGSPAPYDHGAIQATYRAQTWQVNPISKGVWANGLQILVRGSVGYFTPSTGLYSRYDVLVYLNDPVAGGLVLKETFDGLVFTDATSSAYAALVINDPNTGSKLITLVDPPVEFLGPDGALSSQILPQVLGAGDGLLTDYGSTTGGVGELTPGVASPAIPVSRRSGVLQGPILPRTVKIAYRGAGDMADRVITDDGVGNLIGAVGVLAGSNKVNYATGMLAFRTTVPVAGDGTLTGSMVRCQYGRVPTVGAAGILTELMTGGSDGTGVVGNMQMTDISLKAARRGMYAFTKIDEFLNVGIPDLAGNVTTAIDQQTEAEGNQQWFVILATPQGMTPQQALDYRRITLGMNSSYCALYYPWPQISDPVTRMTKSIPPIGHVAGVYARTDQNRSVGKAPAGVNDGKLLFCTGLERKLIKEEVGLLDPAGVNCLVDWPQTGRCVWGASTLENPPGDFQFVATRRLFIFLKLSTFNSTWGFVWENIGPGLWSSIQFSMETFMESQVFNPGMLKGTTPQEAFKVVCDATNNTPSVQAAKQVICDVYVAVNEPGKFIRFRFQRMATNVAA